MKQFYLTGIIMATALLTACHDEEESVLYPHEGVLRATVENNSLSTRAGFTTNDGTFYWSKGDEIGVTTTTSATAFSVLRLAEASIGQTSGNFNGTVSGTIEGYAVYPHNTDHTINGGTLSYKFKPEYTYLQVDADFLTSKQGEGNSFNPPMWGSVSNGNVGLKHLGGIFCIKIEKLPQGENLKLVLTSDKKINGTYNVDLTTKEPEITATPGGNDSEKTVTITFSNTLETSGVFYIPTPVGTHTLRVRMIDNSNKELINAALGTYTITRRLLKKLELHNSSINAGEQVTAASIEEVTNQLKSNDYVTLTSEISGNTEITIPEAGNGSNSKTVAFENINSSTLTVKDAANNEESSVKNLSLSFAKNETITQKPNLTLETPNTTSRLQATAGDFEFGTVTASTAENTLIVDQGVKIGKLIIKKGNVRVNAGATLSELEKTNENTVIVIYEEGAVLPKPLPSGFTAISSAEYELRKLVENGGEVTLTTNVILSTPLVIGKATTLNLNGYHITPISGALTPVLNTKDALLLVRRGATLTITGSGSIDSKGNETILTAVKLTDSNDETDAGRKDKEAKLVVNSGTILSEYYAISGNGNRDNTVLEITNGTISSLQAYAIYSPQIGTTTISGGTIQGAAGAIALQDGTLNISGTANLISKGTAVYADEDGDGIKRLQNAAICVPARYGNCSVTISGGKFTAEENSKTLDITYNHAETNNIKTISISGGTFSDLSVLSYLSESAQIDVKLNKDCEISEFDLAGRRNVTLDLNKHKLMLTSDNHNEILSATASFKNGQIVMSAKNQFDGLNGAKLTFENITITGPEYAMFVQGPDARLDVINSTIEAKYFSVSTNASIEPDGTLTYGANATITLTNSHFNGGETGFMNNVPAKVTIKKCTFTGNHQAAFLRGGDYEISNSIFTLNAELPDSHSENLHKKTWGSGNKAAFAGITIGNYINGAYQYYTKIDMKNVKVNVEGNYATSFPALHICANQTTDLGVTLTYDEQCNFTSAYNPAVEYGTENITVNNQVVKAVSQGEFKPQPAE